eukprot:COSAG04_NODE_892_length_9600_cov_6.428902_3_plen_273_part_01
MQFEPAKQGRIPLDLRLLFAVQVVRAGAVPPAAAGIGLAQAARRLEQRLHHAAHASRRRTLVLGPRRRARAARAARFHGGQQRGVGLAEARRALPRLAGRQALQRPGRAQDGLLEVELPLLLRLGLVGVGRGGGLGGAQLQQLGQGGAVAAQRALRLLPGQRAGGDQVDHARDALRRGVAAQQRQSGGVEGEAALAVAARRALGGDGGARPQQRAEGGAALALHRVALQHQLDDGLPGPVAPIIPTQQHIHKSAAPVAAARRDPAGAAHPLVA